MNRLELEWDTFDFYTAKIQDQENAHLSKLGLIQSFLNKEYHFSDSKKEELLTDYYQCCDQLLLLYKKQMDSISNLIKLNRDLVDIPIEREVDSATLNNLKSVTGTLMAEVLRYKEDMESMLGDNEDIGF
tara:strand:+ start:106 stop:495 length:390 start_codon:yes stop_codon:yes gene_type:complete